MGKKNETATWKPPKLFPDIPFAVTEIRSPIRKTFRLSRVQLDGSRRLVETGEEDIRQLVQSGYSSSLDFILDRFLDGSVVSDSSVVNHEFDFTQKFLEDKLDVASAYVENMEDVAEAFNLPLDMSYDEIRAFLRSKYDEHIKILKNEKGGLNNEKKTEIFESESQIDTSETSDSTSQGE